MGLFGKSKSKRERKEALATLKNLEKTRPQHRRMASTTDPSTAITELQPWQVGQEKSQHGLSGYVHKDVYGREITEPDLTNPTRNRWERPLETIRAFQESIDKGYRRSYYGGEDGALTTAPPSQAGRSFVRGAEAHADAMRADNRYAGNIPATPLSHSSGEEHAAFGVMGGRNHLNNGPGMVTNAYRPGNINGMNNGYSEAGYGDSVYQQGSRGNSYSHPDDQYYGDTNGNGVYPYNGNQNGNLQQQWGPQSNGAAHPVAQQVTGGSSNYQQPNGAQSNGGSYQQSQEEPPKRNVIKLATTPGSQAPPPEEPPKRKSWLGRRLSRGD